MEVLRMNGREVSFAQGRTILEVALANGIYIPTLCWLKDTTPTGACRMCMVEVKGARSLVAACATPAAPGMEIQTESEKVNQSRRLNLELLLASGKHDCMSCPANGDCRLQDLCFRYGVESSRFPRKAAIYAMEAQNPLIVRDPAKCILCGRCVQACNEVQVNRAIGYGYRGAAMKIVTTGDKPYHESDCVFCGQCIQVCPTGALSEKKAKGLGRSWETRKVRTTCPYCGVGCQLHLHVKGQRIVKVTAVEGAQPNRGRLCVKGRFGYDFIYSEERLTTPLIREGETFREASWDEALDLVAQRFAEIKEKHGPDALAGVSCARSINEDSYNMQKLFRAVLGTNNIDHCARVCHAPTVAGLATSFGSGAMTNSFADFDKAKMFFVIGSNMTHAHPVAATFVKNAMLKGAHMIVVDPRKPELCDFAQEHLQIKVGSDIALINGLMHVLITEDLYDKQYVDSCTTGFQELKAKVMEYPPERAAEISGIPAEDIRRVARQLATTKPAMLIYTLGITEHTCGVHNVMDCANLQMLLGNVGFECGGVNPLRGQNNVQGACDMGALPNVYPGYQKVVDPKAQAKFEAAWGVKLPARNGIMMPAMLNCLVSREIKGLYIFGENLASTEADIHHVEHCLASAEFLVCNDIFPTETTRFAHVVLPAAAWSEDDGTFTNSERRVSRLRKVKNPAGQSKPNWWIFKEIAKRMGQDWASASSQEIWDNEVSVLSPPFAGIKYRRIEADGLQWPTPDETHPGTKFLHKDGCFTCGLGNLVPVEWTPPAEVADAEYPFVLSTGRRLYHYHTRTQTGRSSGLNDLLSDETADISLEDAQRLGIGHGEKIKVSSRRGSVEVPALVTDQVPPGMVWMAFHFRDNNANWLTNPAIDPISHTAEYKACAVKVEKL